MQLLSAKYDLTDRELGEMIAYCKERGIHIYDGEEEVLPEYDELSSAEADNNVVLTDEEKERDEMAWKVAAKIIHIAIERGQKRVNGHGRVCGNYISHMESLIHNKVKYHFTGEQLRYIVEHMPEDTKGEIYFILTDSNNTEVRVKLILDLNRLIPSIIVRGPLKEMLPWWED